MTNNNIPWEEDSIKVNDADGNLAFEVIDLVKPEKLVPTYVKGAEYSDWRKDLEENWTNVTTGNKVGQTFLHVPSGTTVSTGGALGGVESIPSTISIDGDPVSAPDITQHNLQGYAIPMGSEVLRKKKKDDTNKKLNASQKIAKKANADVMMSGRVNPELSYPTDKQKVYGYGGLGNFGPAPVNDGLTDDQLNSKWIEQGQIQDDHIKKVNKLQSLITYDNQDEIQKQLDALESEYFKNMVDHWNNWESLAQQGRGQGDNKATPVPHSLNPHKNDPNDPEPVTPKVTKDDERFLKKQQTLVNLTKSLNRIGLPNDFAQWTLNYAKGDMAPITQFSSGMERQVLDLVDTKFVENPNATTVSIQYDDYGSTFNALPTRLGLGRFTATKLSNGDIKITDIFNVDKTFKTVGAADIIPGLQKTADRLVDIAYKRRSIGGVYDEGGIPINVIIRRKRNKTNEQYSNWRGELNGN